MTYVPEVELPEFYSWGDEAQYHTPDREFVYPGRRVLLIVNWTWPCTPEECPGDEQYVTNWMLSGRVLVCSGCGLDST